MAFWLDPDPAPGRPVRSHPASVQAFEAPRPTHAGGLGSLGGRPDFARVSFSCRSRRGTRTAMATTPAAMATMAPMNTRTRMIPISRKPPGRSELKLVFPFPPLFELFPLPLPLPPVWTFRLAVWEAFVTVAELSTTSKCTRYEPVEDGLHWKVNVVDEVVSGFDGGEQPGGVLLNQR